MPRYYFNVRTGSTLKQDIEGSELSCLDEAHTEAVMAAREILADRLVHGSSLGEDIFLITEENGDILEELPFRSVINS